MNKALCLLLLIVLVFTGLTMGLSLPVVSADTTDNSSLIPKTTLPTPGTLLDTSLLSIPAAPRNLKLIKGSDSCYTLSWMDNSKNEAGFKIETIDPDTEKYIQLATVGSNIIKYKLPAFEAGKTYVYRVRAYNKAGNSAYSNEVSMTTPIQLPTPPPTPSIPPQAAATPMSLDVSKLQVMKVKQIQSDIDIGKLQTAEKDVTILYPVGGEVIKKGQLFVAEIKINKAGNYKISNTKVPILNEYINNCTAGSVYAIPFYDAGSLYTDNKLRIERTQDSSLVAESGEFTLNALPALKKSFDAVPGNNSVSLSWEPAAASPGRVAYQIGRFAVVGNEYEAGKIITDFPVTENTYADRTVKNGTLYSYCISVAIDGYSSPIAGIYTNVQVSPQGTIILVVGNPNMTVNGEVKEIDPGQGTAPVIVNGRAFVPIRSIIETMGGTVGWDASTKTATINYMDKTVELTVGSITAKVNGEPRELEVAPFISDTGRTMLPLRFITESLGFDVDWQWTTKTITINY